MSAQKINNLITRLLENWNKDDFKELETMIKYENSLLDEMENLINTNISPEMLLNIKVEEYKDKFNTVTETLDKLKILQELYSNFQNL